LSENLVAPIIEPGSLDLWAGTLTTRPQRWPIIIIIIIIIIIQTVPGTTNTPLPFDTKLAA
jgi:hypothetical protein